MFREDLTSFVMTRFVFLSLTVVLLAATPANWVRSQTAGIVTNNLYLNYDTDITSDGAWSPTVTPAVNPLLDMSSNAATFDLTAPVHLNIDSFYSVNTGTLGDGLTLGTSAATDTWGDILGTAAESRSSTQEIWIRPEDTNQTRAVIWETGGGTGHGLMYNDDGTSAYLVFRIANGQPVGGSAVANSEDKLVSVDLRNFDPTNTGTPVDLVAAQDFIQVVAIQDYSNRSLSLYVNGQFVGSTAADAFNSRDFSGGDGQGLLGGGGANLGGTDGGGFNKDFIVNDGDANPGGGTTLSSGNHAGFRGDVAIHRTYATETGNTNTDVSAVLSAADILQNYLAVNAVDVIYDNTTADGSWSTLGNWQGGVLPTSAENAYVVANGSDLFANITNTSEAASNVFIGRQSGAVAGDGTVFLNGASGRLDIGNDLWLGGNGGNGTLNVGTGATVTVGKDVHFDSLGEGAGVGGTINVTGGSLEVGRNMIAESATSLANLNLSGDGTLFFTDGRVLERSVGNFTQTDISTLRFALFKPNGFSPLSVNGTADIDAGSFLRIGTPGVPPANPLIETAWAAGSATWNPDDVSKWDSGRPDGVGVIGVGDSIDVITTVGGFADGDLPSMTGPDTNWTPSYNGNTLIVTRAVQAPDLGPLHAVLTNSADTVTRSVDLQIRESDASLGADAARLSVRDGTLELTSGAKILVGGDATGAVNVGSSAFPGGVTPVLNVSGDFVFGNTVLGTEGGSLNLFEGTANIAGNLLRSDSSVTQADVNVDGGSLVVSGDITVDNFRVSNFANSSGSFTLGAAKNLTTFTDLNVGAFGQGTFANSGGTLVVENQLIVGDFDDATLGSGDGSTFTHNSGTTTVANGVRLGNNDADNTTFNLVGGTVRVNGGGFLVSTSTGAAGSQLTVGGSGQDPVLHVAGGNLEVANNAGGTVQVEDGTVFINSNNIVVGQGAGSNATMNVNGGVVDLRGEFGIRTDADINFNNGNATLTLDGGTIYASNDIQMGSNTANNQGRTNLLDIVSGSLFVRDDIRTRANGTSANGNKVDIIRMQGGLLAFGEGFATGATDDVGFEGNSLVFERASQHANTYNVFDWTGGTIRGLDSVTGIAEITGNDSSSPTFVGSGAGVFLQKGGTFVLEAGTTVFDGNVAVEGGAIWEVTFTADDRLSVTPNPTPHRAAFIDADGDVTTLSGNGETFEFAFLAQLDLRGSGGEGDTTLGNAVTFDQGVNLNWDATAQNWSSNVLPSAAAAGLVADVGQQFVIAESSEGSINADPANIQLIGDTDWTLSLGTNDQGGAVAIVDNQLIATRANTALNGVAASLAIINGTAGGIVQRGSDLLLSTEPSAGADAAALQVDAQGLSVSGGSDLMIGSGAAGGAGESFVNQNGGDVTISGDLVFGNALGANGGEYNLTGGSLAISGNVVRNTLGENADLNVDGGTVTFGGSVALEDLGVGRKAGTTGSLTVTQLIDVGDDVFVGQETGSSGSLIITGAGSLGSSTDSLSIGDQGTGTVTVGDNSGGTQPSLTFTTVDLGENSGGNGTLNIVDGTFVSNSPVIGRTNGSTGQGAVVIGDGATNPQVTFNAGNVEVGYFGTGSFTLNSGVVNHDSNNFIVGQDGASSATLNVHGGVLNINGPSGSGLLRNNRGEGIFNITGGEINVQGDVELATSSDDFGSGVAGTSTVQWNQSGGVVNVGSTVYGVDRNFDFGLDNAPGNATTPGAQSTVTGSLTGSGELNVSGQMLLNAAGGANTNAQFTVDGGTLRIGTGSNVSNTAAVRQLYIGDSNVSTAVSSFTVNSGRVEVDGGIRIADGGANSQSNSFTQNGGVVVISTGATATGNGNFETAVTGVGEATFTGGQFFLTQQNFIVGQGATSTATLNVSGTAEVNVGFSEAGASNGSSDLNVNDGAGINTINISGGAVQVSRHFNGTSGTSLLDLTHSGGLFDIAQDLNYRGGQSTLTFSGAADLNVGRDVLFNAGGTTGTPSKFMVTGGSATIDIGRNFTMTGTGERVLAFEALAPSAMPVSILNVGGNVSLGGTLELIGFEALDWTSIFGGGSGTVTLINNQGANAVTGTFFQDDGFGSSIVWNEGETWTGDSQWALSYLGGTGNDVVLNYTAMIIPEPSRALLVLVGVLGILMRRRS